MILCNLKVDELKQSYFPVNEIMSMKKWFTYLKELKYLSSVTMLPADSKKQVPSANKRIATLSKLKNKQN